MAVSVESETTGDSDGEPNMDRDGTVSSGNADSTQVNGAWLAREAGQYECPNDEMKKKIFVSKVVKVEVREHKNTRHTTYLEYAHAAQVS